MTLLSLEELRSRYSNQWQRKQTLEDKAKNVISTAGTITSLVFGFIIFSTSVFKSEFPFALALTVSISVITSILAILVSILALSLQKYKVAIDRFTLLKNSSELELAQDDELVKDLIRNYITCIVANDGVNDTKAQKVAYATYFLFASIVLIGIATGITLFLFQSKSNGPVLTVPEESSNQPLNNKTAVYWNSNAIDILIHSYGKSGASNNMHCTLSTSNQTSSAFGLRLLCRR